MKLWTRVLAASAVVVVFGFAGCSDAEDPAETTVAAIDTTIAAAAQTTTTVVVATTTTVEPMDPDAACVDCHTNQETLVALAVEEEDSESLSSGEG